VEDYRLELIDFARNANHSQLLNQYNQFNIKV
jgi:hypothetical protein